jgi:hypothetical protein
MAINDVFTHLLYWVMSPVRVCQGWCTAAYLVACLIKPKSQMGLSYPPNLVHILIIFGFAQKFKFLAVPEVRPNLTSSSPQKYKGFSKFLKGKKFWHVFIIFYFQTICLPNLDEQVWFLRSRRMFRHQDQPNWLMSYIYIICVIWHIMSYFDE